MPTKLCASQDGDLQLHHGVAFPAEQRSGWLPAGCRERLLPVCTIRLHAHGVQQFNWAYVHKPFPPIQATPLI